MIQITNDRFRDALRSEFGKRTFKDKEKLAKLMKLAGFRRKLVKDADTGEKREKLLRPSDKQLDYAYDFLRRTSQMVIEEYVKLEEYKTKTGKKRYVYRNKKGQFATKGKSGRGKKK